jgi:hypothetical protein
MKLTLPIDLFKTLSVLDLACLTRSFPFWDLEIVPKQPNIKRKRCAWAEANGTLLSLRMLAGRPRSLNSRSKDRKGEVFAGGGQRLAGQQITAGMIGDGQRVAVVTVPQQELALVIRTPQFIAMLAQR